MNYKIIFDEDTLTSFIKDVLPDLQPAEAFYVCLFARKKYDTTGKLKSDKSQIKRFTANKQTLITKLKQLQCEYGSYTQDELLPIPQEALAVYINPNPRSYIKATQKALVKFAELIIREEKNYNPHQEVMSQIQQACSRKVYMDFDFDNVDLTTTIDQVKKNINLDCVTVLKTRGGFHLLIKVADIKSEFKNTWYFNISKLEGCDIKGDNLIPIPGCTQGGAIPEIIPI